GYEGRITGQIAQLCRVYGMGCGAPVVEPREPRAAQLALV
ncbi:radical SAM protein, partial [Nonomuraea zeae]